MSIGKVLSLLIEKYNLNALELERLTGVPSSTIYRLLKDKGGNPTIEVLKKLSGFFQITVSQLIGEEAIGCKHVPLIPPSSISDFLEKKIIHGFSTIPIDIPINGSCFATFSQDKMMEPFILVNSVIIIDPKRSLSNQDFVLLIKNAGEQAFVRQIITDGENFYLKFLNPNFPIEMKKINLDDHYFAGAVVHYRTNLFEFNYTDAEQTPTSKSLINK